MFQFQIHMKDDVLSTEMIIGQIGQTEIDLLALPVFSVFSSPK